MRALGDTARLCSAFAMGQSLQACYPGFRFAHPGYLLLPSAERQEFGERAGLSVSQPNDDGLELTFDAGDKDHLISAVLDWICVHLFYSRENVDPVAIDFEHHATIPLPPIEGALHGARATGELASSGLRFVRKGRD